MADQDIKDETGPLAIRGKPLLGMIVEIHGMKGQKVRTCERREQDRKAVSVDGQSGQVIDWDEAEQCYIVHTFEGLTVPIPEQYLLLDKSTTEDGGCDVVYPVGGSVQEFGNAIADWLSIKGYCMVQMSENKQTRSEAAEIIGEQSESLQSAFRQEFESAYLGIDNTTRVKSLPPESEDEPENAVMILRQQMLSTLNALELFTEQYFGHSCWGSSSTWARVSDEADDLDDYESAPISEKDAGSKTLVQSYERFVQGRKTCALYLVENAGGEVKLFPRKGSKFQEAGVDEVTIPLSANKMLLFRHDQMGYAYHPKGPSLAFQSWMLSDVPMAQQNLQIAPLTGVKDAPAGENAQIMSLDTKTPGSGVHAERYWMMFAAGTDTDSHWPASRWETEPYYTSGDDYQMTFKAYTCHGGFMNQDDMTGFDNKFFGISEKEADVMGPTQRHFLDCGYGSAYRAGHTRETLRGENIGVYVGDVGMDWHSHNVPWMEMKFGRVEQTTLQSGTNVGITASRLSHIFDLTGPVNTYDTACSASLVALQAGHKAMMHLATDKNAENTISAPKAMMAGGVNQLLTPISYVANCQAGMLSHVGRCWTFDRTADGYQRGEGTGCMYLVWSDDKLDMEERLACLVGSCSGHDGRSASLTAPNGPAQQDAIRRSMRMAGVDPSLISVCECHGTGTALGDPIEIGSLQGVMRGMRQFPLLNTSAKTNISHLEGGAGMAGVMKCVMMAVHSCGPPNCHLRTVNPNLITEGYPVFFQQELCDTTFSSTFIGVSSFGFGGTNSRADVYGRCLHGPRNTGNVWTPERHELRAIAKANGLRGGYKGYRLLDPTTTAKAPIYIMGSWDDFRNMTQMQSSEPGVFTCKITLGELRQERFRLHYGGSHDAVLFPAINNAGSSALIAGPGANHEDEDSGNLWLIDGSCDAAPTGTQYLITFKWQGEKSISWEALDADASAIADVTSEVTDYYILGTWNRFVPQQMLSTSKQDGLYEADIALSHQGTASFSLQRGKDRTQGIYLDESGSILSPGVGDAAGKFEVSGEPFGQMRVQLSAVNARLQVSVSSDTGLGRTWTSKAPLAFYATGSFNGWKHSRMSENKFVPGVFFYHVDVPDDEPVYYSIEVESEVGAGSLSPLSSYLPGAEDVVRDFKGMGYTWEIILDLNQDDPNRAIYHRIATHEDVQRF